MNFLATALASSGNSTSTLANVEPGVLGFLVVAALAIILVFLFKNMSKQFKKLGPPPEEKGVDISMEGRARREEEAKAVTAAEPKAIVAGAVVRPEDATNKK